MSHDRATVFVSIGYGRGMPIQTTSPLLVACVCLCAMIASADHAQAHPLPRLRPLNVRIASWLASGYRTSPTLASLVDALERSDVIVHIGHTAQRDPRIIGETQFVTRAGGQRYLRISLDPIVRDHAAIALLGHELQHAWEIAERPWVIDQPTLARLYQEIGRGVDIGYRTHGFDTPAGPDMARRVRAELLSARRLDSRPSSY